MTVHKDRLEFSGQGNEEPPLWKEEMAGETPHRFLRCGKDDEKKTRMDPRLLSIMFTSQQDGRPCD